jgi:lipopolysaccharide transport system permease protein
MIELLRNVYRYRELCSSLVRREIAARYKQSALGPLWAVLQPAALMLIFVVVQGFVHIPSEGLPFPVFVYAGLLPWTLFSNTLAIMGPSIVSNAGIVKKIYFPREVFPVSAAVVSLFDFVIALVLLVALMLWYGVRPGPFIVLVPVLLLVQTAFTLGTGFLICAVGTFRRDVMLGAVFVLQLWMYASPVIYPLSAVPARWRSVYLLNPMAGIIASFRSVLVGSTPPDASLIGIAALEAAVVLWVGYRVFKSLERYFADVV